MESWSSSRRGAVGGTEEKQHPDSCGRSVLGLVCLSAGATRPAAPSQRQGHHHRELPSSNRLIPARPALFCVYFSQTPSSDGSHASLDVSLPESWRRPFLLIKGDTQGKASRGPEDTLRVHFTPSAGVSPGVHAVQSLGATLRRVLSLSAPQGAPRTCSRSITGTRPGCPHLGPLLCPLTSVPQAVLRHRGPLCRFLGRVFL